MFDLYRKNNYVIYIFTRNNTITEIPPIDDV